eukprot:CAMPEP_0201199096 /NCGR_PEP_ID=MMETSP0851-20130426/158185_1 /ASSEMBLY_ACC=CAM_ASM_000631 /TAXON_ID=183588 /ORGANISM="Pseudo-nitzschia fraudulenta, Strain WWA7" /LENGTH=42 /DNA_ID= /DNA_START= /DNA_END= /DNA_ORIENTATION=
MAMPRTSSPEEDPPLLGFVFAIRVRHTNMRPYKPLIPPLDPK